MNDFQPIVPGIVESSEDSSKPAQPPYNPWKRSRPYVSFGLGIGAASMLIMSILPHAVVAGWFALALGIPAVLVANEEIRRHPEAQSVPFIVWGKRTGKLGIIIGPATAVIWILIIAVAGFSF